VAVRVPRACAILIVKMWRMVCWANTQWLPSKPALFVACCACGHQIAPQNPADQATTCHQGCVDRPWQLLGPAAVSACVIAMRCGTYMKWHCMHALLHTRQLCHRLRKCV